MKKYELYELQPEVDNFVCDVESINDETEAEIKYFTNKFKSLIVENTTRHQVSAVNGQVQIEVGCLSNQGYIILDTFVLKKGNPFRDIFVSKGFHLEKY